MAYDGRKVMQRAKGEIGTLEGPNNDNKYGKAFGDNNEFWCSQFVWFVMDRSGFGSLYPKTMSTRVSYPFYKKQHWLVPRAEARPGDIVWMYFSGRPNTEPVNHVGFVVRNLGDGLLGTIEGNINNPHGGRDGVFPKQRGSAIVAVGRPGGRVIGEPYPGKVFGRGSTGPAVRYVQRNLNRYVTNALDVSGRFDAKTEEALKKWQRNRRIRASGRVGPGTWAMLGAPRFTRTLKLTSPMLKGEDVKQLKRALSVFSRKLDPDNPTFGPTTKEVVVAWQKNRRQRADGIVDMVTWYWMHAPKGTKVPNLHPGT
ncbi:MAG: peptidoglycan-binding protein [Acidimicrobiia bacterium]